MEQTIDFNDIPDIKLGVDEPFLLMANSESGSRVVFSIESGGTHAEIVDRIQLNAISAGQVTVRATAPALGDFSESFVDKTFSVLEADFYELSESIIQVRKDLDSDTEELTKLAFIPVRSIANLEFRMSDSQEYVFIKIDGNEYKIKYRRFVEKFINNSIKFWEDEILAEEARHQVNINRLKNG